MKLLGKKIIVGVTGGIAAYKAAGLIRLLKKQGADVYPIITEEAKAFIGPLTLQALAGHPALSDTLEHHTENGIEHIALATNADLFIIAPATANTLAKLRMGLADNLLTSTALAATCPILLAPAMNKHMLENAATVDNIKILQERGFVLVGPDNGFQACGETGSGRMSEPDFICDEAIQLLYSCSNTFLANKKVVITAGPTMEYIDPVRYISNRSSGRMGYALAAAAKSAGADVTLISGPVSLPSPNGVSLIHVTSADEMFTAVKEQLNGTTLFIACAAVADFRVEQCSEHKIKKTSDNDKLSITLIKNPDILAHVGHCDSRPNIVAGFAAETDNIENNALKKLNAKGADFIIANDVSKAGLGFDSEYNKVTIYSTQNPTSEIGPIKKTELGYKLIEVLCSSLVKTKENT